jgi:hypothetical protein
MVGESAGMRMLVAIDQALSVKEASGSFLKKRTKKLLRIGPCSIRKGRSQAAQSFLLLFFKKEVLPFLLR